MLGIFIPLIVTNCIVLARVRAFAAKNPPLQSTLDGVFMGVGMLWTLACSAACANCSAAAPCSAASTWFSQPAADPVAARRYPASLLALLPPAPSSCSAA